MPHSLLLVDMATMIAEGEILCDGQNLEGDDCAGVTEDQQIPLESMMSFVISRSLIYIVLTGRGYIGC